MRPTFDILSFMLGGDSTYLGERCLLLRLYRYALSRFIPYVRLSDLPTTVSFHFGISRRIREKAGQALPGFHHWLLYDFRMLYFATYNFELMLSIHGNIFQGGKG